MTSPSEGIQGKDPFVDEKQQKKRFVIEDSSASMAWLLDTDITITQSMGGLFSERSEAELADIYDVLDLGCGCGGWVMDVAHTYPEMEVTGVDISEQMIAYARAHTQVRGLTNAHFRVMDILDPLDFPDNSFDLVNSRIIFGFMSPATWPFVIQESKRVLRPGGTYRMTELETPITNSMAFMRLWNEIYLSALHRAGRTFFSKGPFIGTLAHMGRMLREAGYLNVKNKAYAAEFSAGTPGFEGWFQNIRFVLKLVEPFCVQSGVIDAEEYERIYDQVLLDLEAANFCGIVPLLTVWGEKPQS
ncbi:MAG TPA: methyltransferase domain-containing protein [Ktedonobacteraceae bacterium]|jgi:ubiquinone/menaquinone biosynthesis C-methylase UbiE|nr:methyltransferase domain-containing protein [Ktedonobacteraceae bacterium]